LRKLRKLWLPGRRPKPLRLKAQCLQQVLFSSSHLLTQTSFLSAVSVSTRNNGALFAQRRVAGSMTRIFHEGLSRRPGLW
jgi:hypothetical protein